MGAPATDVRTLLPRELNQRLLAGSFTISRHRFAERRSTSPALCRSRSVLAGGSLWT